MLCVCVCVCERLGGNKVGQRDRWGYVNDEYISLAADTTVKFHGRTPIEMYTDFMASFAAEFQVPCAL